MLHRVPPLAAQALLAGGFLVCLYGIAAPKIRGQAASGAQVEAREVANYIDAQVAEYAVELELDKSDSMVRDYRKRIEKENGLVSLEREAAASAGAGEPTPFTLFLFFLGLACFTFGTLCMALQSTGIGQAAYLLLLLIGLAAGGVGVAVPGSVPISQAAEPDRARQPGPSRSSITDRQICNQVYELLWATLDEEAKEQLNRDDFVRQCLRGITKENLTSKERRCIMQAKRPQELERCMKDRQKKDREKRGRAPPKMEKKPRPERLEDEDLKRLEEELEALEERE